MIQKTKLIFPIIILSKENCKQCEQQYQYFKNRNQLVMKVEFNKLDLGFRQLITQFLKENFNQDELTYPIILLPDYENVDGYYVIVGFSENLFVSSTLN